jgi:Domain of unknown function (DUF4382)
MKAIRIRFRELTAFFICLFFLACQKSEHSSEGKGLSSVHIFLTDDPSLVFEHVFLDISKVEIKVEDEDESRHESEHHDEAEDEDHHGGTSGGWMPVATHPGIYDILRFRNGLDTLFGTASFDAIKGLHKVRVTLGSGNSVVFNGITSPLTIHNNDNIIVINIDESAVAVNSGSLTSFWIDIDAGRSIRQHNNEFELKPNVKVFSREKSASIEGRVLPADASVVVMAINGSDTASAKPEREGEFKFIGLKPGTYTLIYHATANNYVDVMVNQVVVSGTEDLHVPDQILHQ